MYRNGLYMSYVDFDSNDKVFDEYPLCIDYDDSTDTFDKELNNCENFNNDKHHPFRSKSDTENLYR